MRKITKSLDLVKQEIEKLKGQNIKMQVNLGRKKMVNYEGVVEDIYNSVFVVSITCEQKLVSIPAVLQNDKNNANKTQNPSTIEVYSQPKKHSYSFCDVLCGDVKIAVKK